jgi:hypothetical protein
MFQIKQATRELIWTKVALMAPSGGGKTYSALRLATGMLKELQKRGLAQNGKMLMANTEQKRGYYYANEFKYDIVDVQAPHKPEMYVELINYAVSQNYPILIMDSTSKEWEGRGGCLELAQLAGGNFQAWAKITPLHDKFLTAIADSPIHIIGTMRGKDQYELEQEDGKKLSVKKLGIGAKQREGFEYEFSVTFLLDQKTNMASVQKDNTHLFEGELGTLLSEKHGEQIIQWANSGEGYTTPVRETKNPEELLNEQIVVAQKSIVEVCKSKGGSQNPELMTLLKEYEPRGNPNKIKDLSKLEELLSKLDAIKGLSTEKDKE